jgi:putative DNA primase/helicase
MDNTPAPPIDRTIFIGQRNATLASLAGTMRRRGMSENSIFNAIWQENQDKCAPPLHIEEVKRIAASVSRYEPATVGLNRVYPLTDMGNAERMAAQHGQTLRYCHAWNKWLTWDSKRWMLDDTAEVVRRAKETVRALNQEAELTQDIDMQEAIDKWARRSESRAKINAMIDLASAEYAIPVKPEHLDVDRYLLNATNGIIDLKSGELMEHDPAHLMTKLAPYPYYEDAECPMWMEFLNQIMNGKKHLVDYLQRAVGYAITGDTREQVIFILHGTGANGKSTLLEVLSTILDDYSMRTPTETLLLKHGSSISNDVARLKGARFVTAIEAEQGHRLAESMVKQMTGGERLVARFLHAEFFEFTPEFKIFLATNHKPEIIGTDYAIWRRIHLIPFDVTIPEKEQDKDLGAKLLNEASGILSWAVKGCLRWQEQGLNPPPEVLQATQSYRAEMDILAGFLDDCCVEEVNLTVPLGDLYKAYDQWCDDSGEKSMTKREFGMRMRERGFTQVRGTGGVRLWDGVGLQARPNQVTMGLN